MKISTKLLRWYDENARDLPWRVIPQNRAAGIVPDPYVVWLSEIMLQQTTVATVTPRFSVFLKKWPTVAAMATANVDDVLAEWAGLGYYARARNLHKCAHKIVDRFGGEFPSSEKNLLSLPGIGSYTAAAISAIAFDKHAIVVDGNIERVVSRLARIEVPLPDAKPDIYQAAAKVWPKRRPGDFAQGLMDLGATVCVPRNPKCDDCPFAKNCQAFAAGIAAELPIKKNKVKKPHRYGTAFVILNKKGELLVEKRPDKGLLGGMLGLPGTEWTIDPQPENVKLSARSIKFKDVGAVKHTFTHFHLFLDVRRATFNGNLNEREQWVLPKNVRLPTVMKKALDVALE